MDNKVLTRLYKKADFYISLFIYVFCGIIIWQIINTKVEDSRLMPTMVLFISFISATALMISSIRSKEYVATIGSLKLSREELAVILILFACYYLIRVLGFYTSAFLLVFGVSLVLGGTVTIKKLIGLLLYDTVLIAFVYVAFNNFFGIIMPSGIFI